MKYTIFGESHGPAIGVTLTGVPAGLTLDWDAIQKDMARRAPGKSPLATARREADEVQVLSGVFEGKTTGSPLCAMIANTDTRSGDYSRTRDLARPGHADYPAHVRYQGCNDYRGGGHFSGRLTAPLVFAGAIAKQILAQRGIFVGAHISSIYGVNDEALEDWETLKGVADKDFPVLDDAKGQEMQEAILEAKEEQDSVGGSIECGVFGLPAGYGSPDFGENAEGIFSQYLFAVPAVKAVAFGAGTAFSLMRGSEANDPLYVDENGNVGAEQNCAGGINGGITNGMPLVFEVTMRPTPSIGRTQFTIDMARMENAELELQGRHDPCVVPRAVPVIEAAAALAACQLLGI
ncbi:chorismate synthase [Pseudoflavonifractor capillosus]|uniref:chorismate synthase n=1 Tax=Pseudoflavonifractor capillosus TaxID=106588 RepID=UPI001956C84A|nr:chorismate synthase [Pseudoflavonifractor capillosus]MBM6897343.1 chorismate synthase [Pseudoflavonifractor capillosus]